MDAEPADRPLLKIFIELGLGQGKWVERRAVVGEVDPDPIVLARERDHHALRALAPAALFRAVFHDVGEQLFEDYVQAMAGQRVEVRFEDEILDRLAQPGELGRLIAKIGAHAHSADSGPAEPRRPCVNGHSHVTHASDMVNKPPSIL